MIATLLLWVADSLFKKHLFIRHVCVVMQHFHASLLPIFFTPDRGETPGMVSLSAVTLRP